MKHWYKKILFFILAIIPSFVSAQDLDAHSPHQNDPGSKQQKAAEKKKSGKKVNQDKAEMAFRKQNEKMQDKQVRKRMKKNKRTADKWNKGNR